MTGRNAVVASQDPPDPSTYRQALGQFATGIAVVSTTHEGVAHAMTVNSLTSVSLDPLLILVCVERTARFHEAILAAGAWSVSVLGVGSEAASAWFATRGRPLDDQLAGHPWHPGPVTGLPVLDAAVSSIEVVTTAVHPGGDHDIVVGEVVGVDAGAEDASPLIYHHGRYGRLAP